MTLTLHAMRQVANDPQRDEVLIPAYTCYSVPASIERAGLRPRLCDIDPETLGIDPQALDRCDFSRVLAVVTANLYGLPNELTAIEDIARRRGVFLLDDAAQALGARLSGRAVGTFGDAGLYSFDKGKIISTMQGGVILSRGSAVETALDAVLRSVEPGSRSTSFLDIAKLAAYALCLRPTLYGRIRRLPFLGLGQTVYETRFPLHRLGGPQMGVAAVLARRIDELNDQRRRNAARLAESLEDAPGLKLPRLASGAEAVYARFPIRITHPEQRERTLAALDRAGIGASASYPRALADVPEVAAQLRSPADHMPGARLLASQIMTLPTHGYCPDDLAARVRKVLEQTLSG